MHIFISGDDITLECRNHHVQSAKKRDFDVLRNSQAMIRCRMGMITPCDEPPISGFRLFSEIHEAWQRGEKEREIETQ